MIRWIDRKRDNFLLISILFLTQIVLVATYEFLMPSGKSGNVHLLLLLFATLVSCAVIISSIRDLSKNRGVKRGALVAYIILSLYMISANIFNITISGTNFLG